MASTCKRKVKPMRIEKTNSNLFQLTVTGYELATLISSVRYLSEGAEGELSEEAVHHAKQLIENYDRAIQTLPKEVPNGLE